MVGVPILHILHNLVFGEGPLPVAGNDIIQSKPIHHPLTMVADPARGGMSDPLINVANGLVSIYSQESNEKINTNRLEPRIARPN